VDNRAESGLALHNGVWDTHLATEGGKEDNQLNGVNIVGDQDQRCLLVLDESDNVVEAVLGGVGLLAGVFLFLALSDSGGFLGQALLLLGLRFGSVLVKELERLSGS
jgi:hypothetical protein